MVPAITGAGSSISGIIPLQFSHIPAEAGRTGATIVSQNASKSQPDDSSDGIQADSAHASGAGQSGRPAFDRRGTTVWEWQTAPGTYSRDPSTTRVQRLVAPELSLEKTVVIKQPAIEEPKLNEAPCGGFNPYDHGPTTARATSVAAPPPIARAPARRPATRPVAVPPPRPVTLLGRLRALLTGR